MNAMMKAMYGSALILSGSDHVIDRIYLKQDKKKYYGTEFYNKISKRRSKKKFANKSQKRNRKS